MSKTKVDQTLTKSANLFPVVGIGASAGGLDAFKKLLKAIPEDSGMAYVLVQHLDPSHESLLPEILQKVTPIPVLEITDDIKVLPDHIYVIPSNKMMVATDGVLVLAPRPAKSKTERNLPIDLFFASLAEVHQDHAIGVVLSGTASDGTQGLKAIKEHGGITFAQDEASAEYEGMPHSAAQAGVVDFILPPEEIPSKLLEVTRKTVLSDEALQNIPKEEEDVFKQILSLLRIRKGVDFTYYKQTTIRRRILRRMVVNKNDEPGDYLKFLRGNNPEQDLLYQDMLIPVTSFFRDKKVFENLCSQVFPAIIKNKVPGEITRVWVAGCSTGQEVYSFAICFKEFLGDNHERIQIFGTDLSEPAILKARTGLYEKTELDSISPERLKEYFTKSNGGFQVNKSIRDMCVFAHHNFLKDPPFGKMDCISCRNVLIYMEPYLQKKALTTFHYALNPKGFLLLGKSETTGGVPDLFAAVEKNDKLYTRKDVPGRFMQVTSPRSEQILSRTTENAKSETIRTDFQKTADDILLTKYTPAGVVVNEAMDIVHFRGNTSNYLQQSPGKPSHNLLMMAKNGLGFELRNILHKAKTDKATVVKENIPLNVNGILVNISIEAVPLPNTLEPYYLILFHDNNLNDTDAFVTTNRKKNSAKTKKEEKDIQIQLLEQELAQAREDMRSITEDQEASNEELQSANEELLSGTEELQSLNEELETSKEELQSTNEELTVLNHELTGLNEQITDARNYSESIVATLYQPLLVLDKHLRVKTANKAFYKTFKVIEQDTEGVLIYDLGNRQWNIPELRTLLEEILPQKKQITDFEVTHNFLSIGERVILLSALEITREKKEEKLILLSIEDITEKAFALKKIEESEKRYNIMLMQSPFGFAVFKGKNMVITLANDTIKEIWGKGNDVEGKPLFDVLSELRDTGYPGLLGDVYTTGVPFQGNEILASFLSDGKIHDKYFNLVYQPYLDADETISGVTVIAHEVTGQVIVKKALEAQQAAEKKALKLVEETNKRYYSMLMESPFAFCVIKGKDMTITLANDLIKEFWGKGNDVEGKKILQVLPEIKNQPFPALLDKVYTTGIPQYANEMLARFQHKDKIKERYFNIVYQPDHDADGAISGVITIAYDVTEMVLARKKIEESEDRFQAAVAAVEGIVWTNNAKGEMEGEQLGWSSLTGQSYQEYQGYGWANAIHPDDAQPTIEAWNKVVSNGMNFIFEHRVKLKNGNWGHFSVRSIPLLNADGLVCEWVGVHIDISERYRAEKAVKESENRFRQMAELMPQKVWTADAKGNKKYFNKTLLDYAGYSFEELEGDGWQKIIHPEDWEINKIQWEKSISTGQDYDAENRLLRKDGKYFWHLTQAVALKDETGEIKMWVGTKTEIQKIKEEEERKGDFIKMVSHELKTPVTSIKGYVQMLISMLKDKPEAEMAGVPLLSFLIRIDSLVLRLTRLITEMLDLSRLETGMLELKKELFGLDELANEIVKDITYTNTKHVIHIHTEFTGIVYADKDRLGQVLINLINNAIKYSTDNNPIDVNIHQPENNLIAVSVKDYGIGISKYDQLKIFERFFRAGGRSEQTYAGFGIGLYIVNQIMERHQGFISVDSEEGKGSTFTFTLPLATATMLLK